MTFNRSVVRSLVLLTIAGCGSAKAEEDDKFLVEQVTKELSEIKTKLAAGEDPKYSCIAAEAYAENITQKPALTTELAKVCGFDVPLAALEGAVEKAEAARKAKPDEDPLFECYSAERSLALEELGKRHLDGDRRVKDLATRWDAACPPKKS